MSNWKPFSLKMGSVDQVEPNLTTPSQLQASDWVKELPSEEPSMAWRSQLNESILAESKRFEKKRRVLWFARPALGLGLACGLALLVILPTKSMNLAMRPSEKSVASDFVAIHQQFTAESDLTGTSVRSNDTNFALPVTNAPADDWNEADFLLL